MRQTMMKRSMLALALACASGAASAGCSRAIQAPVAAGGVSVINDKGQVTGIYPDLLHGLGARNGCTFVFAPVPRARQVALFENGKADLLLPASRTPQRDRIGQFVPMVGHRALLISVDSGARRAPVASARELLARRELRVAVVRGFDYGEQYSAMTRELARQGRLFVEVDLTAVARLLQAGSADLTIMGPTLLITAIEKDARVAGLQDRLRYEAIPELAWQDSGVYISRLSLAPADQAALRALLDKAARSNAVLDGYRRYYKADTLAYSVRAR